MKYELEGYNIDELIRLLHHKHFRITNLNKQSVKTVSFELSDTDSKKAKKYILNFKVKQKATGYFKRIISFLFLNLGALIGCLCGICFLLFSSSYVWQIKVYGNENLSKNEILQVLKNNGVAKGSRNLKSIEQIESILLNSYDRLAQVSVAKLGTSIIINLSEKLIYEEAKYLPIIAKYSGIIKSINVVTGTVNVKVGDYVNLGDILVLPFNLDSNGNKISVKPLAEIKGEIYSLNKIETHKNEKVLVRSGRIYRENKYYFKNKFLFKNKSKKMFDIFETVVYNENINRLVPLRRERIVYYEMCEQIVKHDFEKEKQSIAERCEKMANEKRPLGDVLNRQTTSSVVGETLITTTILTILGDFCA